MYSLGTSCPSHVVVSGTVIESALNMVVECSQAHCWKSSTGPSLCLRSHLLRRLWEEMGGRRVASQVE